MLNFLIHQNLQTIISIRAQETFANSIRMIKVESSSNPNISRDSLQQQIARDDGEIKWYFVSLAA